MEYVKSIASVAILAGVTFPGVAIARRIWVDDNMAWTALLGGLLILGMCATGFTLLMYRQSTEARRLSTESNLTAARVLRTLDGVNARPALAAPSDLLGSLLAGLSSGDVVDVAPTPYLATGDGEE